MTTEDLKILSQQIAEKLDNIDRDGLPNSKGHLEEIRVLNSMIFNALEEEER